MRLAFLIAISALAGCKPPPGDAGMDRELPRDEPTFASAPLPSPDTQGAIWAPSAASDARIIYGVPEEPALLSLECNQDGAEPLVEITRMAPADEGAEALLALVGNGAIGRIEVDAREVGTRVFWRGAVSPADRNIEPLKGPRKLTATIPGAGMVDLNPSPLPGAFLEACAQQRPFFPAPKEEEEETALPAA